MPSTPVSLLLASASPARRTTLIAAGVTPHVRVSTVDEDATVASAEAVNGLLEAPDVALLLARAKAEDVVSTIESAEAEEADAADHGRTPGRPAGPRLRLRPRARRRGARQAC